MTIERTAMTITEDILEKDAKTVYERTMGNMANDKINTIQLTSLLLSIQYFASCPLPAAFPFPFLRFKPKLNHDRWRKQQHEHNSIQLYGNY